MWKGESDDRIRPAVINADLKLTAYGTLRGASKIEISGSQNVRDEKVLTLENKHRVRSHNADK